MVKVVWRMQGDADYEIRQKGVFDSVAAKEFIRFENLDGEADYLAICKEDGEEIECLIEP